MNKFIITKDYVQVLDEETRNKLKNKYMSASSINAIINSPGNFILDTYVENEVKKKDSIPLLRGHWFHSLMEEFFNNPNRDIKDLVLKDLVNVSEGNPLYSEKQIEKEITKYKDLLYDASDFNWMAECIKGFKEIFDKENLDKNEVMGTELEIITELEGVKVKAYIDSVFKDEDSLKIVDWKTGRYKKDNEDYHFQQSLYSIMYEKEYNTTVKSASLAYVRSGIMEDVVIDKEKTLKRLKTAKEDFDSYIDNDYIFPFKDCEYDGWRRLLFNIGEGRKPDIYVRELKKFSEVIK